MCRWIKSDHPWGGRLASTTEPDVPLEARAPASELLDDAPIGLFRTDEDLLLVFANSRVAELTGVPLTTATGRPLQLLAGADGERVGGELAEAWARQQGWLTWFRTESADGERRRVQLRASIARDVNGRSVGFIGSLDDVGPASQGQDPVARAASILESTSDAVFTITDDGRVWFLNGAAEDMFGDGVQIGDPSVKGLLTSEAFRRFETEILPHLATEDSWTGELTMRGAGGGPIYVEVAFQAGRDQNGQLRELAAVGRDMTDRRRVEAAWAHRALHDPLTGLPNRAKLLDHLEKALARSSRDGTHVALLFFDVDRFKTVNDTRGHDVGDELLCQIADRIRSVLRPSDLVARLGGDEFVILFDGVESDAHALSVGRRVSVVIESTPMALPSGELSITISAGVALSHPGTPPTRLMREADAAMYRAKELGRARLELYDDDLRRQVAERVALADELSLAMAQNAIALHYQPFVSLRTGAVTGMEALARWDHPTRGQLAPLTFIGLAEQTGLIDQLGPVLLRQACAHARAWDDEVSTAPRLHVNISARQLADNQLPLTVRSALTEVRLDPSRLCLEISESDLMGDTEVTVAALRRLKEVGVALAIDDFGTGYSSLPHLRRFPVDLLKVDRSFIDGLGPDPEDSAVAAAIVSLAHNLELEAVAEGVETVEQLSELQALGCDVAQGYLFARPMASPDVIPYLDHVFAV
jgi:diguanylate cyclase (GGDEF)-like protein/PAS domain S-box-containing protein